jgi:tRNA pseudouridine(55) synthase
VLVALDCANESRIGPETTVLESAPLTLDIDHHHDNSRFGGISLVVGNASSTGEVLRDVFRELDVELTPEIAEALYIAVVTDTGRFQYSNTTPKALRLAAELVEAGADVHQVFQSVYESVEFAKLKLLGRALERAQVMEGGRLVVSYLLQSDYTDLNVAEAYSEGIIDYLRMVEGAEMAALIREPPRRDGPTRRVSLRASVDSSTSRRSRDKPAAAATARRLASRATSPSRRSRTSSTASSVPPRALDPSGLFLIDKPEGPSSFAVVADVRRRTGARTGHAGTLDPFATGLLLVLSGRATKLAPRFVGLDKRYLADVSLAAVTDTGDREGELVERHEPPGEDELKRRLAGLRGDVELPVPTASAVKVGGERAYKLHRRGVAVEMPVRRSRVDTLELVSYEGGMARLELHVSSGTYVRAIATALGGHCVSLRRTEVGPFDVEEADPERLVSPEEALARVEAAT